LVLGLLNPGLLLLHCHLLTLERKALLLSSVCSFSLLLLLLLSASASAHGSILVLLLKINGP
jgi:hypothetical protein